MDHFRMVFDSPGKTVFAVTTFTRHHDGIMDEHFRNDDGRLSFYESILYDAYWVRDSTDMSTSGTKDVVVASRLACHVIMVHGRHDFHV